MKILLTNDDGYDHPGIKTLYSELCKNHEVFMMAPDVNKSGFGSALTFLTPLKEKKIDKNIYSLDGTPVDCVKTSLNGKSLFELDLANLESENLDLGNNELCPFTPDIVISGINPGPNLGPVFLYSGTVGAAIEGRNLKYPAIAVSVASFEISDYGLAARTVTSLLENIDDLDLPENSILNLNVPDHNIFPNPEIKITKTFLDSHLIPNEEIMDDFSCLEAGHISLSPIKINTFDEASIKKAGDWLEQF
jgi:5'-nucleotidase|tara:strand:+ start:136 stop:882 length:747 start_codon:yes stop_codon:yes gene_type:complete